VPVPARVHATATFDRARTDHHPATSGFLRACLTVSACPAPDDGGSTLGPRCRGGGNRHASCRGGDEACGPNAPPRVRLCSLSVGVGRHRGASDLAARWRREFTVTSATPARRFRHHFDRGRLRQRRRPFRSVHRRSRA
jgi:hypothetical protein